MLPRNFSAEESRTASLPELDLHNSLAWEVDSFDPDTLVNKRSFAGELRADVLLTTEVKSSTDLLASELAADVVLVFPSCVLIIGPFTERMAEVGKLD